MRALLVIAALHGLVPGFGEIVESAVHYATTGHLPHAQGHEADRGDPGPEHSCGVTLHTCGCCAGQPLIAGVEIASVEQGASRLRQLERDAREVVVRAPARPFRPPIA
jgi:hypothetical protein